MNKNRVKSSVIIWVWGWCRTICRAGNYSQKWNTCTLSRRLPQWTQCKLWPRINHLNIEEVNWAPICFSKVLSVAHTLKSVCSFCISCIHSIVYVYNHCKWFDTSSPPHVFEYYNFVHVRVHLTKLEYPRNKNYLTNSV